MEVYHVTHTAHPHSLFNSNTVFITINFYVDPYYLVILILFVFKIVDVKSAEPTTRIEVWLDDAQWWLTQDDGQLHMCDITFTNCR